MNEVSLAIIAKNAAPTIIRAIHSVRGLVETTILIDTGSTDGTAELAREAGAQVHVIEWPGAFDAALNRAVELVKTPWTFRLDADEWLLPGQEDAFRMAVSRPGPTVYRCLREDYQPDGGISETRHERLWRTDPRLRYIGVIHEHFPRHVITELGGAQLVDLRIGHDGYVERSDAERLRRNIPLLRRELELRPGQWYYEVDLARSLVALKEPEGAKRVNELVQRLLVMQGHDVAPVPSIGELLVTALELIGPNHYRHPTADAIVRLARGWFPEAPGVLWGVAQFELKRRNTRAAWDILTEMEELLVTGKYDRSLGFHQQLVMKSTFRNLGALALELSRIPVAERALKKYLELAPEDREVRETLARLPS